MPVEDFQEQEYEFLRRLEEEKIGRRRLLKRGLAGAAGKKAVLELGGSDPFIVFADADFNAAVKMAVAALHNNSGQSCVCAKRFLVEQSIAADFTEAFVEGTRKIAVGDPLDEKHGLGPLARADLRAGLQDQLDRSIAGGARVALAGGTVEGPGFFFAPTVLAETWQTRTRDDLFFAGQVSGVEGYVESAASGLIAGRNAARLVLGRPPVAPPRTTAIGALGYYAANADPRHYDPTNITFGIIPPLDAPPKSRQDRQLATSQRALDDLDRWIRDCADVMPRAVAI